MHDQPTTAHAAAPLQICSSQSHQGLSAACALFELQHKRRPTPEDTAALRQLSVKAAAESGTPEAAAAAALDAGLLADYVAMSAEMPAVNAVVGGVLANEVLKAVSFSGEPLQNVFFFDAHDGTGMVEKLAQD